jgi:hypothetical protein
MGQMLPRLADDAGLDACIEVQQEDHLPEDQAELSDREMWPEVYEESPSPTESSRDSPGESRKRKRTFLDVGEPSDSDETASEA